MTLAAFVDAAGVVLPPVAGAAADGCCDVGVVAAYGWFDGATGARLKRKT